MAVSRDDRWEETVDNADPEYAAQWRSRAKQRLHDELETGRQVLENYPNSKPAVASRLNQWQLDERLVSVRDEVAIGRLPQKVQIEWREFWKEVKDLQSRIQARTLPSPVDA